MTDQYIFSKDLSSELEFITSKSGGPGGQNVNKVNSKVELRFSLFDSVILTKQEKEIIFKKLYHHINNDGILSVTAQTERSQLQNKQIAIEKFYQWIEIALTPVKPRKKRDQVLLRKKNVWKKNRLSLKKKQFARNQNWTNIRIT